jgi:peptidoglycan L-alanyl-D-glutamate endopeptidase CwlK
MNKFLISILLPLILSQKALSSISVTIDTTQKTKEQACEAYKRAYPDFIKAIDGDCIIWQDGTKMPISDGKESSRTFQDRLDNTTLLDQVSIPYIVGPEYKSTVLQKDYDSGRLRNNNFFKKMYGSTAKEVQKNLVTITWLPKSFEKKYKIQVTKINGIAEKLQHISQELDQLVSQKPNMAEYLKEPGGIFCWRMIAGTDRPSAHSFGMTIDINVENSNYWLWDYKKERAIPAGVNIQEKDVDNEKFPLYRNMIPWEIVEIFEKNGFIWGGKWNHYDTMHFEYRPELITSTEPFKNNNTKVH